MSGQVRGKIECVFITNNRSSQCQTFFKNLYDFFAAHPNYTVIALQYGLTTTNVPGSTSSGTGTAYYDQANSFGYNAFFVVRANATAVRPFDVYYLIQWGSQQDSANGTLGNAPGSPALGQNSTGGAYVIIQAAIGIGGTGGSLLSPNNGNPWKGTTNGNGADSKATVGPIWGAPGGGGTGVMIFPRSNDGAANTGTAPGAHVSRTQNGGIVYNVDVTSLTTRMNVVGDDDSFLIFYDKSDSGAYISTYCGIYTPRPNIAQNPPYPYLCIMNLNALPWLYNSTYGDIAGTSNQQGGICSTLSGTVNILTLDHLANNFLVDSNFWPDRQIPGGVYNEYPIWVGPYETTPTPQSGYLGQITFVRDMFNIPTNDTRADFSRIFLGSTVLATSKLSAPWDAQNSTAPRSGLTRAGVTFVSNIGNGDY